MQNFKFIVLSIIALIVTGLIAYWAVVTIKPGDVIVERQKQQALRDQNEELQAEIKDLKNQLAQLEDSLPKEPEAPAAGKNPVSVQPSKYDNLIGDLQKLADDKVFLKEKSKGSSVGAVQAFLNIYNSTNKKVDNDYGPGTKTDVANFQKAEGLSADGQVGTNTFLKMIDWLKENS